MRMTKLRALTREHRLRAYSRLRKAELIAFLQDIEHQAQRPPPPTPQRHAAGPHRAPGALWDPQHPLHGCLLGNQIDLHRCLLGNWNMNRKLKSDNLS